MSGTVNISRRIWRNTAFKAEPFSEREAFMWMIMEASYKPREKRVGNIHINLSRGQLATSVRFMCEAWGWSKSRVDRYLKRLENRDMIGTESGTGINVITVCKYDDYQNPIRAEGTPITENRDSSGTAAGQQRDKPNKGLLPDERIDVDDSASASDLSFREKVCEAAGHDASGVTATGGFFADQGSFAGFTRAMGALKISEDEAIAVVAESAARKSGPKPNSLKYFIPALSQFAANRDAPLPKNVVGFHSGDPPKKTWSASDIKEMATAKGGETK